ncbi:hypothetical protein C8J56DRAFT_1139426 [Mycena floridula]|nr:hypothetical protein C8J56DRAFT_1139426 [Mycena floridula]
MEMKPAPSASFYSRSTSDRFQPGTKPVLLRNATIWTGRVDGFEVIKGEILMDGGIIKAVGRVDKALLPADVSIVDVKGAWVSPGIVDLHSHLGVGAFPALNGANDVNSFHGPVLPWLRVVDGLNTHDDAYRLAVAGGVTTSLILPGSANAIAGQGFAIKLRPTKERSTFSLLLEPPFGTNGSDVDESAPPRWRHMKHACVGVYSFTRMDTVWSMRQAYDKARQIKTSQDNFCTKARAGAWNNIGKFPEDFQWEPLVDTLRGKVKVQTHCYEAVDIDRFIALSNEFQFSVAAFHHAHEAYLVPEVLKRGYEHPPAAAMFATFSRYKREAYRHSEYAPRVLADAGIKVVMKSDHPGIVSRYLLHEAQQAHHYGLPGRLALASVTTTPAEVMGLDHRIGFISKGKSAENVVVWDSHPLALGATPKQVFIDGIPQFDSPVVSVKPMTSQKAPIPPNFDKETKDTLTHVGLPRLQVPKSTSGTVIFHNVSGVWVRDAWGAREVSTGSRSVVVQNGNIVCLDSCLSAQDADIEMNLEGGWIMPALVSFGSQLGLVEIQAERSTNDGGVTDPAILNGTVIRAVDGLQFTGRDSLLAYRSGIASGITAPTSSRFLAGLSTYFSLGANHRLEKGAVIQDIVALHVHVGFGEITSVSTQIGTLRHLLLHDVPGDVGIQFSRVAAGTTPLVVTANSADVIATLLSLKKEVERETKTKLTMTIVGGAEAHLLADDLAAASVGVILLPPRSVPYNWDSRRIMPGPPLSESGIALLLAKNVTVGLGPQGIMGMPDISGWAARNLRFDAGWAVLESNGQLTTTDALAMASSNIEKLLGIKLENANTDLAVTRTGDLFSFESKVVGIISSRRGVVDLL